MSRAGTGVQGAVSGAGAGAAFGPWGAAIGGGIGLLGGLFGGGNDEAAMAALQGVDEQAGPLSEEDARLKKRQLEALQAMWETAKAGGMDPQAKATLQQAQAATAAAERGSRGAIVQNAQARGVGGSGAELAATLANQQGSAERNAMAGGQAAGDARTRALQAMMQTQSGMGNVRGQDLSAAQAKAQVDQFNARQRLSKAGMLAGQYGGQADQARADLAGAGAGVGALADYATRKKPYRDTSPNVVAPDGWS